LSHHSERKIKVCLNCGTDVIGRYCHVCGQENIEPKETFGGLVKHFFYDITHFDGNFFSSAKYLLFKPGYLSAEYVKGRRASYLHPIRMYVFTSAFFFLVFFSMYHLESKKKSGKEPDVMEEIDRNVSGKGSKAINDALRDRDRLEPHVRIGDSALAVISMQDSTYQTRSKYDSLQALLPAGKRDGWLARKRNYTLIDIETGLRANAREFIIQYLNRVFHMLPQLLFVSLPIYALLLKLLFYRRRKTLYYADHAIFSIHLYVFGFLDFLLMLIFAKLSNYHGFGWLSLFSIALFIYAFLYGYYAMRRFYQQSRLKTMVKYLVLCMLTAFVILILFLIFFLIPLLTLN
jgi:hypothetical protein